MTWTCQLCPERGTNLADWLALDVHLRTAHPDVDRRVKAWPSRRDWTPAVEAAPLPAAPCRVRAMS